MIPKLHISKGAFKLDKIDNISTNTKTNDYCIKQNKKQNTICFKCYSFKGLEFRKLICVCYFFLNFFGRQILRR